MRKSILWLLFYALPTSAPGTGAQVNVCSTPSVDPPSAIICEGGQQLLTAKPSGSTGFPPGTPTWSVDPAKGKMDPSTGATSTFEAKPGFAGNATILVKCDDTSATTVSVTAKVCARCDNPHNVSESIWECHHFDTAQTGTPCSTTRVINSIIDTWTCVSHANRTGAPECNVRRDAGPELRLFILDAACGGGTVSFTTWQTIYISTQSGCANCVLSDGYGVACVTGQSGGTFVSSQDHGTRKISGCP
jgi:hypothetical protein